MVKTPPEIYDKIFDVLSDKMYYHRSYGGWEDAEIMMRVIEFLERHLEKDESEQPPPVWLVGGPAHGTATNC